jgi:hypothetical protein
MKFEVQTRIGATWENVWTEDDAPLTFATPAEAESALLDHLNDCQAAGIEVYKKDFRIRPTA